MPADNGKKSPVDDMAEIRENLKNIGNIVLVLSGKGGVGKSSVAVNLAAGLAARGLRVGLLDVDIHGPSVPKLLGIESARLAASDEKLLPVDYSDHLRVMSIGFLINDRNDPVVWRGPLKYGVIRQFLRDVDWGELDFLIVDSPPGTGDEPLSVCQLIPGASGAVIVTTPQDVALLDVRKSITFCKKLNMPVLGVVENMSGMTCPHCGKSIDVFGSGGGRKMAEDMGVPFIGSIPLDGEVVLSGDGGVPLFSDNAGESPVRKSFEKIVDFIGRK